MTLTLNSNDARKADNFSSVIRESGKYVGVITRAQKLLSKNNVQGLGISFKTDDGATASYLDVYTVKANGEQLRGHAIVQAILCCTRVKQAKDAPITFERWEREEGGMVKVTEPGYPDLMGKRIGFLLQQEIQTHSITGEDVERLNIVAVFEASTGLMASEILDSKTKAEKLDKIAATIARNPVRDARKKRGAAKPAAPVASRPAEDGDPGFDDDIPF